MRTGRESEERLDSTSQQREAEGGERARESEELGEGEALPLSHNSEREERRGCGGRREGRQAFTVGAEGAEGGKVLDAGEGGQLVVRLRRRRKSQGSDRTRTWRGRGRSRTRGTRSRRGNRGASSGSGGRAGHSGTRSAGGTS